MHNTYLGQGDFIRAIEADPTSAAPRLIFADWLEEQGNDILAAHLREAAGIDVAKFASQDYGDWRTLWTGDGMNSPTDWTDLENRPVEAPPMADIDAVLLLRDGENDGPSWCGLFHIKDGRYVWIDGGCDYTGWG